VSFFLYSFTIKSSGHICKGISGNQIIFKWTQENIPFTTMNMQNDWSVAQTSPHKFQEIVHIYSKACLYITQSNLHQFDHIFMFFFVVFLFFAYYYYFIFGLANQHRA